MLFQKGMKWWWATNMMERVAAALKIGQLSIKKVTRETCPENLRDLTSVLTMLDKL